MNTISFLRSYKDFACHIRSKTVQVYLEKIHSSDDKRLQIGLMVRIVEELVNSTEDLSMWLLAIASRNDGNKKYRDIWERILSVDIKSDPKDVTYKTLVRFGKAKTAAVIDQLKLSQPLGLFGGSMGAYTAIKLTEIYKVNRLVLAVPAAYSKDVYDIKFGEDLTKRLREKEGWKNSDAFDILEKFRGKLLVVVAENDEIIPSEVSRLIYKSASKAKNRQIYVLKNAPHKIREYLIDPKNQSIFREYYALVGDTLRG